MTEAISGSSSGGVDPGLTRRSLLVGGTLGVFAVGAAVAQPRRAEHRLARVKMGDLIPVSVGPWRFANADGVVVAREEGPVDGYDQLVSRTYEAEGLPSIMLLVAYGSTQGGSLQLHRPETCYPGQGFSLSEFSNIELEPSPLERIPARRFTATRDERVERLIYWTRISDAFPRNTAQEYRAILGSLLKGLVPDGVLVRLSSIGRDTPASDRALSLFFSSLIEAAQAAKPILVGNVMAGAIDRAGAARNK
ncbi:EpsI family protein [bacterium]|nr:MAG: EpsI family protein [bacterium]